MKFSLDDRGVSEVLGAILVFALLIAVLSIIQVAAVPALNQQVEFEHNAGLQDDMRAFDASVDEAAATGVDQPIIIDTGVRYPPRLFLINPGPTAGTLSTTGTEEVTFGNLEALDSEAGDYINSSNGPAAYTTTGVVYQPNYNQYTAAPETRYEHGVLYNIDDDGGVSVMDRGSIVSGNRISLTTLAGNLATSDGDSVSLTAVPVSAPSRTLPVQSNSDGPLTLTLETSLSAERWETDILAGEMDTGPNDGRYVTSVVCENGNVTEPCNGPLTITFEEGVTYNLRTTKVAVSSGAADEPPAYLTKVGPASPTLLPGGTDLTVELRDRYNAPIAGKNVSFKVTAGSATFPKGKTGRTDAEGRVTVPVVPTGSAPVTIKAWYDANGNGVLDSSEDKKALTVVYDALPIGGTGESGDQTDINPRGDVIEYANLSIAPLKPVDRSVVDVTFKNNATAPGTWTITRARIPFVLGTAAPTNVDITRRPPNGGVEQIVKSNLEVGGPLTQVQVSNTTINNGAEVTFRFDFDEDVTSSGAAFDGLIILTFEATNSEEPGKVYKFTYFVGQ